MSPLVSILIPAYNAEAWVAETIRSALNQTWPNKEILVVDDGSLDRTAMIARQFDPAQVTVISQPNQGAAAARNHAYSRCRGDYVQWLDADDLLAPDKIATQMAVALQCRDKRTLFSASWGRFFFRTAKTQWVPSSLWCDLSPREYLLRKIGQNCFMQTSAWLVSRELSDAAGPWDTRLLGDDDGEYFCRVAMASNLIRFVPESKVYYRQVGGSRLSFVYGSNRRLEADLLSMQLHIAYLRSVEDSERARTACLDFLQISLSNFHPERPDLVEQINHLASTVDGKLESPRLHRKYSWLEPLIGTAHAKRAQVFLPRLKDSLRRIWDQTLFRLGGKNDFNE